MKGLIFTYLMCYGGSVVALFRPWYGLLVYVAFSILRPVDLWSWSVPPGNYSRIVAMALLAGWAFGGFGNLRFGRSRAIVLSLAAFFFWATVSYALAFRKDIAWPYLETLIKILLPWLIGATMADSMQRLRQLAWTMVLSQGYVAFEFNLSYLNGFNIAQEGFAGMGRAILGCSLVSVLALTFFLYLGATRMTHKAILAVCGLAIMHSVFLTFSRGAILALIITGGTAFALIPKRAKHYVALVVALLIGLRMAGAQVRERFASTFETNESGLHEASAQSRLDMWAICGTLIRANPLFGVGPEGFTVAVTAYGFPEGKEAHSLWIETAAELGIPGAALLAGFYLLTIKRLLPIATDRTGRFSADESMIARMVVAALVGFSVTAQFVSVQGVEVPYFIGLLGAGLLKQLDWARHQGRLEDSLEYSV